MSVRRVLFTLDAWDDYIYWQGQDRKAFKRINQLFTRRSAHLSKASASPNR
ncbi:YoeB-like toxin of type II toxin-antitoxin system [Mycetohabitans endofungorum]|uniref:YoeB-like toxin of type II toxin-antitoxin system n=1 Tax=Mycetohabitans endofungorum TaxID=417203 RepID=A0A2P5KBD7_9BURK|nr:YoeB-like toxin of type II toxin-antitoxin system [Mycetohabitans endofungorum]